ncbi:MAG: Holliday junction branch migration DNA helicase RuvB [Acidobacteriota bacterium]|jgi:holliday junction DNA helicase RuvB
MTDDRLVTGLSDANERVWEAPLRPKRLDEFIGQKKITENLRVFIQAAMQREEALDHVLIAGPPGLGKTTLAHVIAREMNVNIRVTAGPLIEKAGDLAALLTGLETGDILFIDEIHRLSPSVEEVLYPAMEDYKLDLVVGQGPGARNLTIPLNRFTLIGATTRLGLLTSPLRNRFGITFHMLFYGTGDLVKIVKRSSGLLTVPVVPEAAEEIARRSRGTPRVANRLLRRLRDYAQILGDGAVDLAIAVNSLERLEVDRFGLDELDRRILTTIIEKHSGGPVGISTLSASIGEEKDTLEEIYEPYLMQIGFLKRTPRGRCATDAAFRHLGIPRPPTRDPSLFSG